VRQIGAEGIVSKRRGSLYRRRREPGMAEDQMLRHRRLGDYRL
jgi:hypothetical protein